MIKIKMLILYQYDIFIIAIIYFMDDKGNIIIYRSDDGNVRLDVRLENETVWLTQQQIATLFGKDKRTISEHIINIFKEEELDKNVVVRNFRVRVPLLGLC